MIGAGACSTVVGIFGRGAGALLLVGAGIALMETVGFILQLRRSDDVSTLLQSSCSLGCWPTRHGNC